MRRQAELNLPEGYGIDPFKPALQPVGPAVCLITGADLYKADAAGDVEMVTGHIDHVDATGITLRSDRHLAGDAVITATGIHLQATGAR